ncbi:MAG: aldehyde dehydrogenase family protein [Methylotenera sp.]|nr:aldehyde dehydrogenase family protein [Oligoflexia bacterium]
MPNAPTQKKNQSTQPPHLRGLRNPYIGFTEIFVAGVWRKGRSQEKIIDVDPYRGETLLEIHAADASDLNEAYQSAKEAQKAWASAPPQFRRGILLRVVQILEMRKEEIISWLVRETGSTLAKAALEHMLATQGTLEAATYPFRMTGEIIPCSIPGKEGRVYRQPAGVVGVISPWDFSLQLTNRSVAPALAAGNAVVLKPASTTPITGGLLFGKIYEEAGLPPGVLNVIVGSGHEIGDLFVTHPVPRVITFTGSTEVGRHIGRLCGENLKKASLELGGNCPFVVLEDADVEQAVNAGILGKFLNAGQICMAINRFLIHEKVYDQFLALFTERVKALKWGDPGDPAVHFGPIIDQKQFDAIQNFVRETIEAGARVVLQGPSEGLVMHPVILADVTMDMPAARTEIFGPVALFIKGSSEEELLQMANDTEYGLSSAVFTRDLERGARFARKIEAGMSHVNDMTINDEPNSPFGGEKASGIGRFGGQWALNEFTTEHWITIQEEARAYPF